jgi:hypothetical protein
MEREYKLFGRGLDEKETEAAAEAIDRKREESVKPIEGELKKTPEEIKLINLYNSYLQQEFEELDIKEKPEILPEQIHLFSHENFIKTFPNRKDLDEFHESETTKAGYLNKDKTPNRIELYNTILHAIIHIISFHKYLVEVEEKKFSSYRTGYRIADVRKIASKDEEHLRWFNEAVADKTTQDIFLKHFQEIIKELNIPKNEEKLPVYYKSIDSLNAIISKIAKQKGEDENTVWQKIKRGQFTGEMMHLRDVEKYPGKGELERLAHFGNKE